MIWTVDLSSAVSKKVKPDRPSLIPMSVEVLPKFPHVVWKVTWSPAGSFVYFSYGDGYVSVWRECPDASWICLNVMDRENEFWQLPIDGNGQPQPYRQL